MSDVVGFPTILVIDYERVHDTLVRDLRSEGYLVLVAQNSPEALEIVRMHSRTIHIMLTAETVDGQTLAAMLKQYRPKMQVVNVMRSAQQGLDTTLNQVREFLTYPRTQPASLTATP